MKVLSAVTVATSCFACFYTAGLAAGLQIDLASLQNSVQSLVGLAPAGYKFDAEPFLYNIGQYYVNGSFAIGSSDNDSQQKQHKYIIKLSDQLPNTAKEQIQNILKSLHIVKDYELETIFQGLTVHSSVPIPHSVLVKLPFIDVVEQDYHVKIAQVQQLDIRLWNLDYLDQSSGNPSGSYAFDTTGENTHIYIIDSGVDINHPELAGRATTDYFSPALGGGEDCAGHGTHVAGISAGTNVGIAKKASVHNCRVIDCDGSAQNSDIILAIDWIVKNHKKPAVINMSLGPNKLADGTYPKAEALDSAVIAANNAGITVVIAAGNDNSAVCMGSPAGSPGALTVGAVDRSRTRAWFSNYGDCVKMFAAGDNIYSSIPKDEGLYGTKWGTSQATPLVAGMAALYLQRNPAASPQQVLKGLQDAAVKDVVGDSKNSQNFLLQSISKPSSGSAEEQQHLVDLFPLPGPTLQDYLDALTLPVRIIVYLSIALGVALVTGLLIFLFRRRKFIGQRITEALAYSNRPKLSMTESNNLPNNDELLSDPNRTASI